jgi:microsomal prostaglandin-E synthase 2
MFTRGLRLLTTGPMAIISLAGANGISRFSQCSSYTNTAATLPNLKVDNLPQNVTVYQYKICPFCHRVKAYLDYLRIPYITVEVNPLTKSELRWSADYKKVPIVVFDDKQLNDSGNILDHINQSLVSAPAAQKVGLFPDDTAKWMEWSEKRLAVLLYPNITRSFQESWECFGYTMDVLEWNPIVRAGTRFAGAAAMSVANDKIKKKYNIVNERAELETLLCEWTAAVGDKAFLHGSHITMPDLMVYGVLRSIEGFSTWNEIMKSNAALSAWYKRVQALTPSCEMVKK